METIKKDDYVIIEKVHGADKKLIHLSVDKFVHLNKQRIDVSKIVGSPFNSVFEMNYVTKELTRINDEGDIFLLFNTSAAQTMDTDKSMDEDPNSKDNRFLLDDGKSQKLSRDDVEVLKSECNSGQKIINTLVENSTTFKEKTPYAQAKYLKKKQKKYSTHIRVHKPTVKLLIEMYYEQGTHKINHLRIDTLAQILTMCNIRCGGRYMVVDNNLGLMAAAIIERMIGSGYDSLPNSTFDPGCCVQVYLEKGPTTTWRQAVYALNLPDVLLERCLCGIPIHKIANIGGDDGLDDGDNLDKELMANGQGDKKQMHLDERVKRKENRKEEEKRAGTYFKNKSFDSLVILSGQTDPSTFMLSLYEYLELSRPFAIYCYFVDPLIECFKQLKGKAALCKITESWLRRYQVLPERTRPEVSMTSSGGYILTGIKIDGHSRE